MKYKCINGYTKEKMKQMIMVGNNGTRSMDPSGGCAYRGLKNNKCAVGCFIPDIYAKEISKFNDQTINKLLTENVGIQNYMPLTLFGLGHMQMVHDRCYEGDPREALYTWIDENVE